MNLPADYNSMDWKERRAVRFEYIKRQGGKCSHCGTALKDGPRDDVAAKPVKRRLFPPRFFEWPVHLHHCHKTGMTIGAVHAHCNAVLWQYHGE
jgi:hypothetical protein